CGKPAPQSHAPNTAGKTIGVTLLAKSDVFYQTLEKALRDEAAAKGFNLDVQSAEKQLDTQQNQIENFITKRVSAIIVCPVDSKTIAGAIRQANKAKIPVFAADIAAEGGNVVSHIASDNIMGGRLAGQ